MKPIHIILLVAAALVCASAPVLAESTTNAPLTEKSIHWADTNLSVQVFLVQRQTKPARLTKTFSLFVAGGEDLTVVYRTSRNSSIPVVRELKPKASSSIKGMREFQFAHGFSRTTIWMAIVFKKDNRRVETLTRTFYGSIDELVQLEPFLRTSRNEDPQQPTQPDK